MENRIIKLYCLDCKIKFDKEMNGVSLVRYSRTNTIINNNEIETCPECKSDKLMFADYIKIT